MSARYVSGVNLQQLSTFKVHHSCVRIRQNFYFEQLLSILGIEKDGYYPSHYLPKHDLESVIYVMASVWGYQLPWDADLIGEELTDFEDYFDFKSKITDQEVMDLLPSCLIKAFKHIMKVKDNETPNYERIKWSLYSADESPWALRTNGHARVSNSKVWPIKLRKIVSVDDDCEEGEVTHSNLDDSCHAYDISAYQFNKNFGSRYPIL